MGSTKEVIDEIKDVEIEVDGDRENFNEDGVGRFKLVKPVEIDGKLVEAISFDLSSVSIDQYERIKSEVMRKKSGGLYGAENTEPALNSEVDVRFFAAACEFSYPELRALSIRDYLTCERIAKAFLLNMLA